MVLRLLTQNWLGEEIPIKVAQKDNSIKVIYSIDFLEDFNEQIII